MGPLYSIADILAATGGRAESVGAEAVSSVSIDSRDIAAGALFVAIRGESFDGHDFVAQAVEAGAVAALVGQGRAGDLAGLPLIVVPDALEGLNALARFSRARSRATVIAVTGSVGKTSTKEAIRVALAASGKTHASIRSFNNHWGVPLTLARMPADTRFGVFEIGMNHAGEIAPLAQLVRPHVAVVTNVGPVHLEFFDSVDAIADAKAEIFSGVEPGGTAVLGKDHDHFSRLRAAAERAGLNVLSYGGAERAGAPADASIAPGPPTEAGMRGHVSGGGIDGDVAVAAQGAHALSNAVAALLVTRVAGGDVGRARAALAGHGAPEGRGATIRLGPPDNPLRLVDESYNANPLSMRAALDNFRQMKAGPGRKILVLGDMLELGPDAPRHHADLAAPVRGSGPDLVFLVGPRMRALADAMPQGLVAGWTQTVEEIGPRVLETLAYGDSVMLKGSNGVRLSSLVARIRERFGSKD